MNLVVLILAALVALASFAPLVRHDA